MAKGCWEDSCVERFVVGTFCAMISGRTCFPRTFLSQELLEQEKEAAAKTHSGGVGEPKPLPRMDAQGLVVSRSWMLGWRAHCHSPKALSGLDLDFLLVRVLPFLASRLFKT